MIPFMGETVYMYIYIYNTRDSADNSLLTVLTEQNYQIKYKHCR